MLCWVKSKKIWGYGTEIGFVVRGAGGGIVGGGVGETYADLPRAGTTLQDVSAEAMSPGQGPYEVQFAVFPQT